MLGQGAVQVGEVDPLSAYQALDSSSTALLIDVRTQAEWSFVGAPDLAVIGGQTQFIEWQSFPTMAVNDAFAAQALAMAADAGATDLYFICRSGGRSMRAAMVTSAAAGSGDVTLSCFNVAEGFEGDLDASGQRGRINGWKARDLPWRQT